ncbi:MAG: hypothetical protein V7746_25685 [Halioglobus sp.]
MDKDSAEEHATIEPPRVEVETQLAKILSSSLFSSSKRLADFLQFITQRTLDGEANTVQQSTIAAAVYQRDASFNPSSDPLVRVEANRLRKALTKYYSEIGQNDPLVISIPLRSYVPRFVPADKSIGETPLQLHATDPSEPPAWQLPTLGVLPFNSQGTGAEADQLMFEEILSTDLSQFPTVRVLPFSEPTNAAKQSDNIALARELGLDFALGGVIRCSSSQLCIDVSLLDVNSREQLWSHRYETGSSDGELFDFPYQVSRRTSALVADAYGAILKRMSTRMRESTPPESALYEAVLRFFEAQQAPEAEKIQTCLSALESAAPLSQHSAEYFALLGYCLADTTLFQRDHDDDNTRETALRHIRQAVAMEPTSSLVQNSRAFAAMLTGDLYAVADASHSMVQYLPNSAFVLGSAGFFLATIGEDKNAMDYHNQSLELNLRHPAWFYITPCFYNINRGQYELALRYAGLIGLNDFFWEQILKASLLGHLGRYDAARIEGKKLLTQIPDFIARHDQLICVYALYPPLARQIKRGLELAGILPGNT